MVYKEFVELLVNYQEYSLEFTDEYQEDDFLNMISWESEKFYNNKRILYRGSFLFLHEILTMNIGEEFSFKSKFKSFTSDLKVAWDFAEEAINFDFGPDDGVKKVVYCIRDNSKTDFIYLPFYTKEDYEAEYLILNKKFIIENIELDIQEDIYYITIL